MSLTKIKTDLLDSGAVTADKIAGSVNLGGPKITNIEITNNSYTVLDDTAVDVGGGYIKLTGTGFASGCQVLIGTTAATSTTFVSATEVRAQVPAQTAGSYVIYLVNTDGGVAIRVNGLTYSTSPNWSTGSTLTQQEVDAAISIQLSAAGASTYSLAAGSSLPGGLTLSSGGLLSGTVTGLEADTTYSFTVTATDTELQDSPRTFSLTVSIIISDPNFKYTTLLLSGEGTNNATNNTFLDSSTNNFTITRNGNTTQGSFGPFAQTGWSAYFDGTGDALTVPYNVSLVPGTGDFTIEMWFYTTNVSTRQDIYSMYTADGSAGIGISLSYSTVGTIMLYTGNTVLKTTAGGVWVGNTWNHLAISRSGTSLKFFVNGSQVDSATDSTNFTGSTSLYIGAAGNASFYYTGHISNVRFVKGTAVYTANFTPPTAPLTAIANTSLLTLQDNRFKDNSSNNFAITRAGDTKIQAFSPFAPAVVYDAATHGASAYFDGTGDSLSSATNFETLGTVSTFTMEGWIYPITFSTVTIFGGVATITGDVKTIAAEVSTGGQVQLYWYDGAVKRCTGNTVMQLNAWNYFAIVVNNNAISIYVNKTTPDSLSGTTTLTNRTQTYGLGVGAYFANGSPEYFNGYLSNLRYSTVNRTISSVPTAPLSSDANTRWLLNFSNAGIQDATAKNVLETVGDVKISTAVKKYGTGSMAFDSTGDYLTLPGSQNFVLGTGNFTIEGWFYTASANDDGILQISTNAGGFWGSTGTTTAVGLFGNKMVVYAANQSFYSTGSSYADSAWHHFALVRNNSVTKLYVDGVLDTTLGTSGAITDTTNYTGQYLVVGGYYSASYLWNGYLDDLRITRGVARYTTTFTPPDKALPVR